MIVPMLNLYGLVILTALLVEYVLGLISGHLNLRALTEKLPRECEGIYDAEEYRKSQQYTRDSSRFGRIADTFQLLLLLLFWFAGGFQIVDAWVRGFGWGEIGSGLIFVGILALAGSVLSLPFSIYDTFVLEERYGFNKTTPGLFAVDLFKFRVKVLDAIKAGITDYVIKPFSSEALSERIRTVLAGACATEGDS